MKLWRVVNAGNSVKSARKILVAIVRAFVKSVWRAFAQIVGKVENAISANNPIAFVTIASLPLTVMIACNSLVKCAPVAVIFARRK